MKPRVYLETSVVSYFVGRLSRDVVVLGNQELTREWWGNRRAEYDLFVSEVVIAEAAIGDADLARQRLAICENLRLLALLSWNCSHIANATIRRAIDKQCRASGYEPPVICTPQELIER